jgi:hypothetical protein
MWRMRGGQPATARRAAGQPATEGRAAGRAASYCGAGSRLLRSQVTVFDLYVRCLRTLLVTEIV